MGYIGLPTASTFATHGLKVIGVDVNQRILDVLQDGEIHIQEPGLKKLVQQAFDSGNLRVDPSPGPADAFIIAVPTPIQEDHSPDMTYVVSATESILPFLRPKNLVVLESTCPPRTTLDLVAPILERSGMEAGVDFHLVYSPERVLPGKIILELVENARVIGGVTPDSARAGRDLYQTFVQGEIVLSDSTTAEIVKLLENTYRDINIAAANEFSRLAQEFGVDVWEAIRIANRHPRVNILQPGPGVGGHCISVDPWFLVDQAPEQAKLIRTAREINDTQPLLVVDLLTQTLGSLREKRIAVLGMTYKANVDDLRESPAMKVVELIRDGGARPVVFEPNTEVEIEGVETVSSLKQALQGAEAMMLLVDHDEFDQVDPTQVGEWMAARNLIDTRAFFDRLEWEKSGFHVSVLGVGERNG
jgi:UDP-N-acetyl-D-mannosaminuronic acid dehydrogenase